MKEVKTFAFALVLLLGPLPSVAQDQTEAPDDWLVAFTLSMAAAQYGGACQSGSVDQCQVFAELWFYGQAYAGLTERCAASNDPYSAQCAERQTWAAQILENFGPVQGLDEVLEAIGNLPPSDPWIRQERCLSSQYQDEPYCRGQELFLESIRE